MRSSKHPRLYAAVTVWLTCAIAVGQQAPAEKCVWAGTVRVSTTQVGLGQVTIRLIPAGGSTAYEGSSKADGSFRFEGVAAGDYRVATDRRGYSAPAGMAIHLAPGQVASGSELRLTPQGTISGKVMGPDGEPLPSALVTLIDREWRHGERVYTPMAPAEADDAGVYRFREIPGGRYWLYATRPQQGPLALLIREAPGKPEMRIDGRYYPNAAQLEGAAGIELHAGEELSGLNVTLPLAPTVHVSGVYTNSSPDLVIAVDPRIDGQPLAWARERASVKDGKFEVAAVTAGDYFLRTFESGSSAETPLTVASQDIQGIVAPQAGKFELRGRVRVDGETGGKALPVQILYEGSNADEYAWMGQRAVPKEDGTFAIAGLHPDRYALRIGNVATDKEGGFYLKSLRVNGSEVGGRQVDLTGGSAEDVELILSAEVGNVEGTVARNEEPANLSVVAIPVKVASGDLRPLNVYPDTVGHFEMADLEPGTYRLFGVPAYDRGLWQNAEFLRQIASLGVTVEVAEKANVKVALHALLAADIRQVEERIE